MILLGCESERGYAVFDDVLPTGTPLVTCQAKCPKCRRYVVATYLGHFPGQELPKQIEHHCPEERRQANGS